MQRTQIGEFELIALPDGAADLQAPAASLEMQLEPRLDWAELARRNPGGFHGPEHLWRIHNTCYLVRAPGLRMLVDCGVGEGPYPWYAGLRGQLPQGMAAAGLEPDEVTHVFLTHAHPDHVGWAFDEKAGAPRFRNARYLLHQRDWDHFSGRTPVPKHFTRFVAPLARLESLDLLAGETELAPGVTALETPGHTPGHMSLLLQSRGEGLVISGDVVNSPVYVSQPQLPFPSDADHALGIRTRLALMERIEGNGLRLASAHFPEPGWGGVVRIDGRRWFAPGV